MMSPELWALRAQAETAHHAFTSALAAYHALPVSQPPAPVRVEQVQMCRAAGELYAVTLTILLIYLDQEALNAQRATERARVQRDLDRLHEELSTLPALT